MKKNWFSLVKTFILYRHRRYEFTAFSHGCYYRSLLEDWLQEEDISPKRVLEFGTIEAILCVKSNMGVAIMMKSILKGHEHDISFNPLPNSFKKVPTTFITRKDIYFAQLHYKNLWR